MLEVWTENERTPKYCFLSNMAVIHDHICKRLSAMESDVLLVVEALLRAPTPLPTGRPRTDPLTHQPPRPYLAPLHLPRTNRNQNRTHQPTRRSGTPVQKGFARTKLMRVSRAGS